MFLTDFGVIITGGGTGIGKVVAKVCVAAGADVVIAGRTVTSLSQAAAELAIVGKGQIITQTADVSKPGDVDDLIATAYERIPHIGAVINAAAIQGPVGELDQTRPEDWAEVIQVNLIGTMLVSRSILPHFRKRGSGRIINFSGGGATAPRAKFSAYGASKAAVVRFTETLAQELQGTGILVNAIAPGAVNTRMLDEVLAAGPERAGQAAHDEALKQQANGGTSAECAASLCLKLLSPEAEGITGKLLSAVWDPWESLESWKDKVIGNDIYTLRRITPGDRGVTF